MKESMTATEIEYRQKSWEDECARVRSKMLYELVVATLYKLHLLNDNKPTA